LIKFIEDFWKTLEEKYRKRIKGISVGGMGEAGLLIDKNGKALTPIYSWLDKRGTEELSLLNDLGKELIFQITGLKINPKYSLAKILWLKKHHKDIWKNSYKWLNAVDYIVYYFTKKAITDFSLGSRMLLFDLKSKTWSQEILDLCKIPIEKLPELKPAGSIIEDNKYTFVLGGHDHPIGSLALDLRKAIYDSWGTAEAFLIHTEKTILKEEVRKLGFSVGCIFHNLYHIIAGIPYSGGITRWIREKLKLTIPLIFNKPTHIFFFPYLMGKETSSTNQSIKALFYGIDMNTSINDLKQAIWEGVFYESRFIIENLKNINPDLEKIFLAGGMTRYKTLSQLKANILNTPVYVSKEKELTSKGLGYLISLALRNNPKNFKENNFILVKPDEKVKEYNDLYMEYKKIKSLLEV
ncbi:MAG: FGGY-family carbohydrate kinase, partial [Dictyoglomus sp.]